MPNWCSTSVVLKGERAAEFYKDLTKALEEKPEKGADKNWIGHLFVYKGIDCSKINARSFVQYKELEDNYVRLDNEDAWGPKTEVYNKIAEMYNLTYVYIAEEPGCQVFINTDKSGDFFSDRYYFSYESNLKIKNPTPLEKVFTELDNIRYFSEFKYITKVFSEYGIECNSEEDMENLIADYEEEMNNINLKDTHDIGFYKYAEE